MIERQNLSVLYAPLHPNDGTVEFVSLARAAGNYFVRKRMFAQAVPTARKLLFRTNLFMINGGMGLCPMSARALDLVHSNAGIVQTLLPTLPHLYIQTRGYGGGAPMFTHGP